MDLKLPANFTTVLNGYSCEKNDVGMSTASVYRFQKNDDVLFLKLDSNIEAIKREFDVLVWLNGKLNVPKVVLYGEAYQAAYLLETAVPGTISCDDNITKETVRALADGLLQLQAVNIAACPFDRGLNTELQMALQNVQNGVVDTGDFEESSPYKTPMELYEWLCQNRVDEQPCFSHGDYCLPNVLIHNGKAGFIDNGNAGVADKWKDIALCVRSIGYNLYLQNQQRRQSELIAYLFECLDLEPNWQKIDYYIKLDELF